MRAARSLFAFRTLVRSPHRRIRKARAVQPLICYCRGSSSAPGGDSISGHANTTARPLIEEDDHFNADGVVRRRYFVADSHGQLAPPSYRVESAPVDQSQQSSVTIPQSRAWARLPVIRWVAAYFLPVGYPSSVRSPDYSGFYKWLFVQNVAGSTSYIMSMEALLHAVGVSSSALGWAAAASWVLKDGLGSVGMIFAAKILGDNNKFDADTLRAKWRADVAHNVGVSFELMTLIFPALFLPLASLANTLKGIAGLTNGACRASINRHLAIQNNLGDVTAKGQAQGLAAYLTGLGLGVGLDSMIPALTTGFNFAFPDVELPRTVALWIAFGLLACIHVLASHKALRAIALRSLNVERSSILFDVYLRPFQDTLFAATVTESSGFEFPAPTFLTPLQLRDSNLQPIVQRGEYLERGPKIKFGRSINVVFPEPKQLEAALDCFRSEKFLVSFQGGVIYVVLHTTAVSADVLAAYYFAFVVQSYLNSTASGAAIDHARMSSLYSFVKPSIPHVLTQLTTSGWNMSEILLIPNKIRYRAFW